MPTRVVGTCCCGPPPFMLDEHFWVQIDTTYSTRSDGVDPWGRCTGYTITPLASIPARFQVIYYFPPSQWNPSGSSTGRTYNTDDWTRTSLLGVKLSPNLLGGSEGHSFDPNDWVALFTNISDESLTPSTRSGTVINLIGATLSDVAGESSYDQDLLGYMQLTSAWSRTFTYDGVSYVLTAPAGTVMGRGPFYPKSTTTDDDDDCPARSWYASYSFMSSSSYTIERAPSGSGS